MLRVFLCSIFSLLCLEQYSAAASPNRIIDKSSSSISFDANAQIAKAAGDFNDYAGRLTLSPRGIENSRLDLKLNLAGVEFNSAPFEKLILLQSLVRAIPDSIYEFASQDVSLESSNTLRISGITKNRTHQQKISFLAQIIENSPGRTRLRGSWSGNGAGELKLMGKSDLPLQYSGKVYFDLVFRPS